jgi:hypothetical protein
MAAKEGNGGRDALMVLGGAFGGTFLAELLQKKPTVQAPDTERLNFIADLLLELIRQDGLITQGEKEILDALAALVPGGIPSSILTPWVEDKDPDQIFNQAIRNPGVFFTTKRVDFRRGKRLAIRVENTLDQPLILQTFGNFTDTEIGATDINGPIPCLAAGNANIGLGWDDWQPYIGVRINVAVAPTMGFLRIWSAMQE